MSYKDNTGNFIQINNNDEYINACKFAYDTNNKLLELYVSIGHTCPDHRDFENHNPKDCKD